MTYEVGQIFTEMYPPEAADWCNEQTDKVITIKELEPVDDVRRFQIVDNTPSDEELAEKEQERINNLTMTALDFITGLQTLGLSLETINTYLENNLELKMQLTYCQNVYCSVVKGLCPLTVGDFTLTEEIAEALFLLKSGEMTLDEVSALIGVKNNGNTNH